MPEGLNEVNEQGTAPTCALKDRCSQCRSLHVCQGGISEWVSHVSFCMLVSCLQPIAQLRIRWSESGHLTSACSAHQRTWMVCVRCCNRDNFTVELRWVQPSSCWVCFKYWLTLKQSVWYREGAVQNLRAGSTQGGDADDDRANATSLGCYWQQVTLLHDPSQYLYDICYTWFCSSCYT